MNADTSQLLREKATLLIRRERELFELRHERSRTEAWLSAFYKLTSYLHSQDAEAILSSWADALVEHLNFQVAAAYRYDGTMRQLHLLHGKAHAPLVLDIHIDGETFQFLSKTHSGCYLDGAPHHLQLVAQRTGLQSFFWLSLFGRSTSLLLLAGYSRSAGRFYSLSEHDLGHYALFGNHLAALLDNIGLITALEQEKSELHHTNQQLDCSLHELRDAQKRLIASSKAMVEISRRAGMADVATGVLHNVGNALNSVNVSAELVVGRLRTLKVDGVRKLGELLAGILAEAGDAGDAIDARLHKAPRYLEFLGEHLATERDTIATELRRLQQNIDHIKSIVSKQQVYTKTVGVLSPCNPAALMEDALRLVETALLNEGIELVRCYEDAPDLLADHHKVVQILVNLMSNAKHALIESEQKSRVIRLSVCSLKSDHVQWIVEDNGVGIPPEVIPNVFKYGFTTREDGHGFGLHTSILAAQDMDGDLKCISEGRGKGARFVLELPVSQPLPLSRAEQ